MRGAGGGGWRVAAAAAAALAIGCGGDDHAGARRVRLRLSGSAVGAEGAVLATQLRRFEALHPDLAVEVVPSPDAADQRHQMYVQWLNAGAETPDVLQLDVIWTAELAAAGWILALDRFGVDAGAYFPAVLAANRWQGHLYAAPLFVDAGMLYYRTDLVDHAPASLDELVAMARQAKAAHRIRHGLVVQAARYEGLVTVFLEILTAHGGAIADGDGRVVVDSEPAARALGFLRDAVQGGVVPTLALGWQEEDARLAFQNGDAVFMRNWPYAYPLLQDANKSKVAGRFAVAPMPAAAGGRPAAALGGAQLAINARSRHPDAAWQLIAFLTAPEQQLERARVAGEYPPSPALYRSGALDRILPVPPADALRVIERAVPRPVTPIYAELSTALQIQLHRALSGQVAPGPALATAADDMRRIAADATGPAPVAGTGERAAFALVALAAVAIAATRAARGWRRRPASTLPSEERHGWLLVAPAVAVVAAIAVFPLAWTAWESLHAHDLRMPARGRPFVGVAEYAALAASARFWAALAHTLLFAIATVTLELGLGLGLALLLHRVGRGRGAVRALTLLPWAIPTVVAALIWRFLFADTGWLVDPIRAWGPLILADVWKTTPFAALLLLAGLQGIDETLYDAARTDGASAWQQLVHVTLPLLKPALLVVLVFRTLDAVRVFDLVFVATGGGPGTATEPISLYAFTTLLGDLRFGRGSALSMVVFALAFGLALVYVRLLRGAGDER